MRLYARTVMVMLALGAELGCTETQPKAQPPNEPSPNASILPAPLASALEPPPKAILADAGKAIDAGLDAGTLTPEALREDRPPPMDVPVRAEGPLRDSQALRLYAEFHWLDLPAFPRHPETNPEALQRLREAFGFALTIDLSQSGRLRAVFDSDAFVLPKDSELRARDDYYGHVFVFDDGRSYASVAPGTLRALLVEGRADAAPLTKPKVVELGASGALGMPTAKRELGTPLGRLVIEQANLTNAGAGATLLCRMLAELIAADPANAVCARRELPLRAELFSSAGGHLLFEIRRIERDPAIDPLTLLAPPADGRFVVGELPERGRAVLPRPERLREIRARPTPRSERPDPSAPKQGLLIQNRTESLRYVLLDGLALARVPPRSEVHVEGLLPGKYSVGSLDFLGDDPTPLRVVEIPARFALGELVETER